MSTKYICFGGWVRSASDGDTHYIQPSRLAQLYNISPDECIFIGDPSDRDKLRGYTQEYLDSLIQLFPRNDGDYTL